MHSGERRYDQDVERRKHPGCGEVAPFSVSATVGMSNVRSTLAAKRSRSSPSTRNGQRREMSGKRFGIFGCLLRLRAGSITDRIRCQSFSPIGLIRPLGLHSRAPPRGTTRRVGKSIGGNAWGALKGAEFILAVDQPVSLVITCVTTLSYNHI